MKKPALILVLACFAMLCMAQEHTNAINDLIAASEKYQHGREPEKLYLQLDKQNYGLDDTLWFKAYLFDAASLKAAKKSNIVYVELSNEDNAVQLRRVVIVKNGIGAGCIPLNKLDFPEGSYVLRAYTQWMRNFDESLVYKKQFNITDVDRDKWLVNFNSLVREKTAQLQVGLTETNKAPIANQQVLLGVKQGSLVLRRDKPQLTSPEGTLELAVAVKDDPALPYLSLHKGSYENVEPIYRFPIIYNRPEKTDVQFMPESGCMVAGINSIVGFKAIGEDGKGQPISGKVIDADNNEVIAFESNVKGMGSFSFAPLPGINYKAVINLPGGLKKKYALPQIKPIGTVLSIINSEQSDSIEVKVTVTPGLNNNYILIAQSRGVVCAVARVVPANNLYNLKLPKSAFATGVVRFTLLNSQLATLNERVIFIDHKDNLQIRITPDKNAYDPQDSISLHLQVSDNNGNPVSGNFSMSVVNDLSADNGQKLFSSILTNVLFTSDIKGEIEDPEYYLADDHQKDLDDLMLTQGWTAFDWKEILVPRSQFEFAAETNVSVLGKVTNLFGKPVKNARINLLSKKPSYRLNTQTNNKGNFLFENLLPADSAILITAKNDHGNSPTYGIELYRYKQEWPVFSKNKPQLPWYVITDTVHQKIANELISIEEKNEEAESPGGRILKEVNINQKKIIKGSHNLNGPGNADEVIDEHDLARAGKITLLQLLKTKVDGFREVNGEYYLHSEPIYVPPLKILVNQVLGGFIVDGRLAYDVYPGAITDFLNSYTTEDIKGVEIMSKEHTANYEMAFLSQRQIAMKTYPIPFIEITTRNGVDPFMKKSAAEVIYKPVPQILSKDFYRPRYVVKNATTAAFDNRITIHWEPNIITDKNGKAIISFYAGGKPATYTIITEGSDMNGAIGSSKKKLTITRGAQ